MKERKEKKRTLDWSISDQHARLGTNATIGGWLTNTYTTTTGARPAIRGGGWTNILQKHSPLSAASLGRTRRQCGVSLASSAQSGHSAPISELAWGLEDGVNFSSNNERPTRIDSANRLLLSPTPPSPPFSLTPSRPLLRKAWGCKCALLQPKSIEHNATSRPNAFPLS